MAEEAAEYEAMAPDLVAKKISQLEKRMFQHAQDLEFEEAAAVRDEIERIQDYSLGLKSAIN